ncbi:Ankyrin repeat domain-containing protein 50 [Metarhizium brunneum]|uniref:Ankyrin repeat domain-containing protein 50 n=1 Tax=Metarhizium brunneum TaxID=500148 RepID=A0A7D5UQI3_9HYPO
MPSFPPSRMLAALLVRWHSLAYSILMFGLLFLLTALYFLLSQGASRLQRRLSVRITLAEPGGGTARESDEGNRTPRTSNSVSRQGNVSSQLKSMHVRSEDTPTPAINTQKRKLDPENYTVGWICALRMEHFAACALLDEEHQGPEYVPGVTDIAYTLGRMGQHNVVIVVMPEACSNPASVAARHLSYSFPNIRFGLMVGIGGGAPSRKNDVRLGDIVVSVPRGDSHGVFQYDLGRTMQDGSLHVTSVLNQPPIFLRNAVDRLQFRYEIPGQQLQQTISSILKRNPRLQSFKRPHPSADRLYRAKVTHPPGTARCETSCGTDPMKLVRRNERDPFKSYPAVHYGVIASASQMPRDAFIRDKLVAEKNVICFEMEAAGLMSYFPCLVIRSIYNYADSHNNDEWLQYAAISAAAYAKDLLYQIPIAAVKSQKRISDILKAAENPAKSDADASQAQRIAKQQAARRAWSPEEVQCLQSLRLAGNNENTAYEWYKNRVEDPLEGTCLWFLQQHHFQKWQKQDSGVLLLLAGPGHGKSVLVKYLVDHGLPKTSTICYFFFQKNVQDQVCQALCALLHQLFSQNPALIDHAMLQFRRDKQGLTNSTELLWGILKNAVKDSRGGPIIFVLDALDVCTDSDLRGLAQNIHNHATSDRIGSNKLKYLLTSRPDRPLFPFCNHPSEDSPHITIFEDDTSRFIMDDVTHFVTHRVAQLSRTKDLLNSTKSHLEWILQGKRDSSHLWIRLVFEYLERQNLENSPRTIDIFIAKLPMSVPRVYGVIFDSLESQEQPTALKVLNLILAANRPLTISEVNIAMSLHDTVKSIHDIDLQNEEDLKTRLQSMCGSFISIYKGSIYFRHETAREFLLTDASLTSPIPSEPRHHSTSLMQAHTTLVEACVLYLNLLNADLELPEETIGEANAANPRYAFLDYSAKNWASHFRQANITDNAAVIPRVLKICDSNSRSYAAWFEIYRQTVSAEIPGKLTNLMLASHYGHLPIVDLLLQGSAKIEGDNDKDSRTPLSWAAQSGYEAVARLLLEEGANIEAKDSQSGRTPLSWAAENGHEAVVRLLLDKGANIEAKDSQRGQTPLSWAVENGHEAVVGLLLQKGANIEAKDSRYGRTPLSQAAESGREGLVWLLLHRGADIYTKDKYSQTPLYWAARMGHEAVVQLLLEKGATIEAEHTINGQTPLLWAAENGHEVLTWLLLDQGADIEAINTSGWTPLLLCAKNGHEAVVKLLLERSANIESKDTQDGRTPLSWAAENGHKEVVMLLLKKGAHIEAKDTKDERTPLSWAAERGHGAVVKLLLRGGANVETRDNKHGWTPLAWAAERGHKDIVDLLIDGGSDFEVEDNTGQTPLLLAGRNGYDAIVGRLLSDLAGFDVRDENGRTLLSLAAEKGYENIVRLLLKDGAAVDPTDRETDRTPLSWAAEKGHEEISRLLLDSGADVGLKDFHGQTPLSWAAKTDNKNIVALLQEASELAQRRKEARSSGRAFFWDSQVTSFSNHEA